MATRFSVSGQVFDRSGAPAPEGTTVILYRRELRRRTVLTTGAVKDAKGAFRLPYGTETAFGPNDMPPHLELLAVDAERRRQAVSEVFFCPELDLQGVKLTLEEACERPGHDSELERLLAALGRAIGTSSVVGLDARERQFVVGALCREHAIGQRQAPALLERLAAAEQLADSTGIPLEAAYGLLSTCADPSTFDPAALDAEEIAECIERAVAGVLIPAGVVSSAAVADRLARLAPREAAEAQRVRLRLLDAFDGRPLPDAPLALSEADDPVALSGLRTDPAGRVLVVLAFEGEVPRRFVLSVFGPTGATIAAVALELSPGEAERDVHVALVSDPRPGNTDLEAISNDPAVSLLVARGIRTVGDLLRAGDVDGIDAADLVGTRRAAQWHAAGLDAQEAEVLLALGFDGPLDVARVDRARFLELVGDRLDGPERAAGFHAGSRLYQAHVARVVGDAWLIFNEGIDPGDDGDEDDGVDFSDIFDDLADCGCDDCNSALSPGAYLANMLDWITAHVVSAGAPIRLEQLEDGFHQPFSNLATECDAAHEKFCQNRLAIEVLWPFTGGAAGVGETVFNGRHADYRRAVYRAILAGLNVPIDDLFIAQAPDPALDDLRDRLAQRLGVAVDDLPSFALAEAPDEATLEDRFGLRRTNIPHTVEVPLSLAARLRIAEHGRRWLAEDGDDDAWGPDQTEPAIDPRVIDDTAIRLPRDATNPAFVLYEERRDALQVEHDMVTAAGASAAGLLAEISTRLSVDLAAMQDLRDTLTGATPATADELATAQAEVRGELLLELGAFLRLVEIAERLVGEGDLALDSPAILNHATEILVGQHAAGLREAWIGAESDAGIGLTSALFHQPDLPDAPRSTLLVPAALVAEWRLALLRRSSDPVIDPHHLSPSDIAQFVEPGFDPFADDVRRDAATDVLAERQGWADGRRSALVAARTGAGGIAAQYAAVLATSAMPDLEARIDALLGLEAAGHDIERPVEQLAFTMPGFRAVVALGRRATAGLPLLQEQWELLFVLLVEAEKRLRATEWRAEERDAGISIHPRLMKAPRDRDVPVDATARAAFARRWARRRSIRDDAIRAAFASLERAVAQAEEATLHILRDALIRRGPLTDETLAERRAALDARLLVAMDLDGCACTTRIAFAVDTLQRFLRGVLDGGLTDALANVAIDAEDVAAAESLLSYQEWRAAMFAFLWPENLTSRVLPSRVSHGLRRLVKQLPNHLLPQRACSLSREYTAYFHDICDLEVSATCLATTFVPADDVCDPGGVTLADRLFLFGHAKGSGKSGQVYWAMLDPAQTSADTRVPWGPLEKLGEVTRLLGATIHGGQGKSSIVLLVEDRDGAAATLRLREYDLEAGEWRSPRSLNIPDEARNAGFHAAILRKYVPPGSNFDANLGKRPTIVALHILRGGLFLRRLRQDLSGWADDRWWPIQGPTAPATLKDFVQIRSDEAVVIIEGGDVVACRTVSLTAPYLNDDFDQTNLNINFGNFAGAIGWTGRGELISFIELPHETRYRITDFASTRTGIPGTNPRFVEMQIQSIEERLREELGVSLDDPDLFTFESFRPFLQVPHTPAHLSLVADHYNPLQYPNTDEFFVGELERPKLEPFSGTLYNLLTLTLFEFNDLVGDFHNEAIYIQGEERVFYLIQYKNFAIDAFVEALDELTKNNTSAAYWWTFLDEQIKRLTEERHGIRTLIRQTFYNDIAQAMVNNGWDPLFNDEDDGQVAPIRFIERTSSLVVSGPRSGGTRVLRIAGTAGFDHLPGNEARKPVAVYKPYVEGVTSENGAYWTVLRRTGGTISAVGDQRLAPSFPGDFSILPPADPGELADRRDFSLGLYENNADGPPSIQSLLRELTVLVPLVLGDALCAAGRYDEAHSWFRTIYDAGADPELRKISYGLVEEEARPLSFTAIDNWLRNPEDVHAIALTRRESDTRRVLLSIIACLLAEADALFVRDRPETISKARDLYRRALELLARLRGTTGVDRCADIIGRLRFELEDRPDLPIDDFVLVLGELHDPGVVRETVTNLVAIARDTTIPQGETARRMRERLAQVRPREPDRRPVIDRITRRAMVMRRAEPRILARNDSRALLTEVFRTAETRRTALIARIAEARGNEPNRGAWLAARRDPPPPGRADPRLADRAGVVSRRVRATRLRASAPLAEIRLSGLGLTGRISGIELSFCIPQNPEIEALRRRAETALDRIRNCRNFAGYQRPYDPYGGPVGIGGNGPAPGLPDQIDTPPLPLRYGTLLPQARQLADVAAQIEARYLAALEGDDRERLNRLQVAQNLEIAEAGAARSALTVGAGEANVERARRQRERAIIGAEHYDSLIEAGQNKHETNVIKSYLKTNEANPLKQVFKFFSALGNLGASFTGFTNPFSSITDLVSLTRELSEVNLPHNPIEALDNIQDPGTGGVASGVDAAAKGLDKLIDFLLKEEGGGKKIDVAALEGFRADLERRSEDWRLKRDLARQDIEIGAQEIVTEQFSLELAKADQVIAELKRSHADAILTFLQMKNLTAEAYRWMATILGEAYREVLQRAAATGQVAEQALAFERFAPPAAIIAGDYWQVDVGSRPDSDVSTDLRGLTGSARLLRDLTRLEEYSISSLTQRVPIKMEVDLALLDAESFERFRQTGVFEFDTTRPDYQAQLPGFYAASISSVSVNLQALSLTGRGLWMTLESRGMSRVVVRPDTASSTLIRGLPEVRFLTGVPDGDDRLALIPQTEGVRGAFEGTGFEQSWRLVADRGANALFDFDGIIGMIFTIHGTALYSPLYADQVRNALGPERAGDAILSLRRDFPSAWLDLGIAAASGEPLTFGVALARGLYPVNFDELSLDHLMIAVVASDDAETAFDAVLFTPTGSALTVGGAAETVDGRISTRNGTGAPLHDLLDGPPTGSLRLRFADSTRSRLLAGRIGDILIVPSYSGKIT